MTQEDLLNDIYITIAFSYIALLEQAKSGLNDFKVSVSNTEPKMDRQTFFLQIWYTKEKRKIFRKQLSNWKVSID